ncbi:uncharacterized protein TRIADDRAFT_28457 [Trichoplax adhaerens]|uniref:Transcription elongation factor SPT4 n=1 Tax=Trichoplax adhaerens TaxID=10228 RepID=B3S4E4_TRIAD|nr:hypothetical protein TRIADDRAFT_28457 [Trichoplax adhaerens]EDV22624.1 hypothetical protein TRIADDRAFT_28457 [Trichoplax adhaerens]|eukprot:XP_002115168.1 hypothetical protein TRIADDRAFT_28457 [Trichoplax adhaerens]
MDGVPREVRNLRACLVCSLVKASTIDQFELDGCENCDKYLHLKGDRQSVYECTSPNFSGMISLTDPKNSWVARWQGIDSFTRGCYAISVTGRLPQHVLEELQDANITYRSRDISINSYS